MHGKVCQEAYKISEKIRSINRNAIRRIFFSVEYLPSEFLLGNKRLFKHTGRYSSIREFSLPQILTDFLKWPVSKRKKINDLFSVVKHYVKKCSWREMLRNTRPGAPMKAYSWQWFRRFGDQPGVGPRPHREQRGRRQRELRIASSRLQVPGKSHFILDVSLKVTK